MLFHPYESYNMAGASSLGHTLLAAGLESLRESDKIYGVRPVIRGLHHNDSEGKLSHCVFYAMFFAFSIILCLVLVCHMFAQKNFF